MVTPVTVIYSSGKGFKIVTKSAVPPLNVRVYVKLCPSVPAITFSGSIEAIPEVAWSAEIDEDKNRAIISDNFFIVRTSFFLTLRYLKKLKLVILF